MCFSCWGISVNECELILTFFLFSRAYRTAVGQKGQALVSHSAFPCVLVVNCFKMFNLIETDYHSVSF